MFKPKAKAISSEAKMNTVSNYKGEYIGKSVKPPTPIRPRSSHRDQVTDAAFGGETTVSKSYRPFTNEEARNARIRLVAIKFENSENTGSGCMFDLIVECVSFWHAFLVLI